MDLSDFANKFNFMKNLNLGDTIEHKEPIQLNGLDESVVLCGSKLVILLFYLHLITTPMILRIYQWKIVLLQFNRAYLKVLEWS
jgi:hypothetical protein